MFRECLKNKCIEKPYEKIYRLNEINTKVNRGKPQFPCIFH